MSNDIYPGKFGPKVRVIRRAAAWPSSDYVVQVHKELGVPFSRTYDWVEVAKFNDMADDYALTNAHNRALTERAKIVEGEA